MDASLYKDFTTSRGLNYHYYYSPPTGGQPTLLLSHGWPSSSYDWHGIIESLQPHGYGFLVPDQLGYGGTAKPEEVEAYKPSLISRDVVDILDHEGLARVVAVGHDW
jgi:soluble epoxide hydrolase / lipid-phosphate phosphatase